MRKIKGHVSLYIYIYMQSEASSPATILCLYKSNIATCNFTSKKQRLSPGKTGWPLLGENLDYFFKVQQEIRYKFVAYRMNKYSSKIFRTSLIGQQLVVLCNAEGNKFLFSNEKKLVQVWWPSTLDKLFAKSDDTPCNEHSLRIRKLFSSVLKADVLNEYVSIMDTMMKLHLRTYWNGKEVKVGDMAKKYMLTLACNIFLGIKDHDKIEKLAKAIDHVAIGLHSMPLNLPGTALNCGMQASKLMREELEATIKQRKIDLSEHEDIASHRFIGGWLCNSAPHNYQHYEASCGASRCLQFCPKSLETTAQGVSKKLSLTSTTKDIPFQEIHWILHATHKNPEYFPDPEIFDPSRFQGNGQLFFAFVPFGGGPRREKIIPDEKVLFYPFPRPAHGLPVRRHLH
ncbi:hypothetical protein ACH5RR_026588 [Cinchona calisaya]|uniref:Uncharacterized protein n=1 Tax=Cinchona calisaya TaxID=153742 RepID=A0ABD2Z361_9GENT